MENKFEKHNKSSGTKNEEIPTQKEIDKLKEEKRLSQKKKPDQITQTVIRNLSKEIEEKERKLSEHLSYLQKTKEAARWANLSPEEKFEELKKDTVKKCLEIKKQISEKEKMIKQYESDKTRVRNNRDHNSLIQKIEFERQDIHLKNKELTALKNDLRETFFELDPERLIKDMGTKEILKEAAKKWK